MRRIWLFLVAPMILPAMAFAQGANPFGPEFRVNTYTTGNQSFPDIASNSAGNFVVVWQSTQGGFPSIVGQRYASSGSPVGSEFVVNTGDEPSVALDSSGNFVVAWRTTFDGSGSGIMAIRYSSSGAPIGSEFFVNTVMLDDQMAPSVASDAAGNFVVVWLGRAPYGSGSDVLGQRFASTGTPLGPEFLVNTYTTISQVDPAIASDPSGNFVVVWESPTQDGSGLGIFGQRYASTGMPMGSEFRVNTYTTSQQRRPSVAATASGFVVAWDSLQDLDGTYAIVGQRYDSSGAPLGPEFRVNSYVTGRQIRPDVATDPLGNFVVAWQSEFQDGSEFGIFNQRYSTDGSPLGSEFRVNTYTTDAQFRSAVVSDASGNFVVVWGSDAQDGSLNGIFGQRYGDLIFRDGFDLTPP